MVAPVIPCQIPSSRSDLFTSDAPLGFAAGDANLTRYVGNSAPNFLDPSGLAKEIIETGVRGIKLFLEWWPELGTGEIKVLTRQGKELAIAKYVVNVKTGEGVCHLVNKHAGKVLPGVAHSTLTRVTPQIEGALLKIVRRTGGELIETRIRVLAAQEAAKAGVRRVSAAGLIRGLGALVGSAIGAVANVLFDPDTCRAEEFRPPTIVPIEVTLTDLGVSEEEFEELLSALASEQSASEMGGTSSIHHVIPR